jgi:ATP-dependent Lon protease
MTGEITLRGEVLPIGGLKEKLLAALRAGTKTVVIPEENVKDLAEIGDEVKTHLEILPASRMDDVLKVALQRMPTPIVGEEEPATAVAAEDGEGSRITAH